MTKWGDCSTVVGFKNYKRTENKERRRTLVVVKLVAGSLPTPEIRGSNPVIGNFIYYQLRKKCVEKREIKKKEAKNGPFNNQYRKRDRGKERENKERYKIDGNMKYSIQHKQENRNQNIRGKTTKSEIIMFEPWVGHLNHALGLLRSYDYIVQIRKYEAD